jgi:hypothetical protein
MYMHLKLYYVFLKLTLIVYVLSMSDRQIFEVESEGTRVDEINLK